MIRIQEQTKSRVGFNKIYWDFWPGNDARCAETIAWREISGTESNIVTHVPWWGVLVDDVDQDLPLSSVWGF